MHLMNLYPQPQVRNGKQEFRILNTSIIVGVLYLCKYLNGFVIDYRNLCTSLFTKPRSGELRTQKLKSHLVRKQSLNVLPLKPGVGQYIAIHATLTARDFFFAYFYPSSPYTCIFFFQNLSRFFLCRAAERNRSPCQRQVPVLSARGI